LLSISSSAVFLVVHLFFTCLSCCPSLLHLSFLLSLLIVWSNYRCYSNSIVAKWILYVIYSFRVHLMRSWKKWSTSYSRVISFRKRDISSLKNQAITLRCTRGGTIPVGRDRICASLS
jgi:hypothetical protein